MDFTTKLLREHAEMSCAKAILEWQLQKYEDLLDEIMGYLCEEDILAAQFALQYKRVKERGKRNGTR